MAGKQSNHNSECQGYKSSIRHISTQVAPPFYTNNTAGGSTGLFTELNNRWQHSAPAVQGVPRYVTYNQFIILTLQPLSICP